MGEGSNKTAHGYIFDKIYIGYSNLFGFRLL